MDRGAWWVAVPRVAELDMTEGTAPTHACTYIPMHFSSEKSLMWKPVQGISQNPQHSTGI